MSKKDFELIAATIKAQRVSAFTTPERMTLDDLSKAMAQSLAYTNSRFDKARFLKACGVEG